MYKALDPLGKGEMTTVDFIKNLKASQELATKFGMPERLRRESTSRDSYQFVMGSFECNEVKSISVRSSQLVHSFKQMKKNPLK